MATSFTSDEYGMEVNSIEGDATILPNTIMPNVDDEFVIDYTKEKLRRKLFYEKRYTKKKKYTKSEFK